MGPNATLPRRIERTRWRAEGRRTAAHAQTGRTHERGAHGGTGEAGQKGDARAGDEKSGRGAGGAYWTRTSDPRGVNTVLYQLS